MFNGDIITVAGIGKITLPARTLFLCDGGMVRWGSEVYLDEDSEFGSIGSFGLLGDSVGDLAPGGSIGFIPVDGVAAATLSNPAYQHSRIQIWLADVNWHTGFVIGAPAVLFDGLLRNTAIKSARGTRRVEMDFVSRADRLFRNNQGNVCSDRFHQSIWAGELGFVNATGVPTTRAFGIAGPPRGTFNAGSGGQSGGLRDTLDRSVRLV